MRATLLFTVAVLLLASCNSVKRNQKFLASGNYDEAIRLAVKKLSKDNTSKKSGDHVILLEDAYKKAVDRDKRRINFLTKDLTPGASREIFYLYRDLEGRQDLLRPILPYYSVPLGRNAKIKIADYSDKMIAARNRFADDLYTEANSLLSNNTIPDARLAYERLEELRDVKSNYSNLNNLLQEARFQGTDFVKVEINNRSGHFIPGRLQLELLDFNTYGLDDFWTEYHVNRENGITYNFGITLDFEQILVSPERISEKEFRREKRIKDGWEYVYDRNGNVKKDSLGNDIKTDVYKIVTARVMYTTQTKQVAVGADVRYLDLIRNREINSHPLATEFIFENKFAKFRGDERALTEEDLDFLEFDFVPFPSNEQMVYDAGEEIKARLKTILSENSIR
ncbi:MAG: hypothetical protein AAF466_08640 [Bacteroidota bacterium]